MDSGLCHNVFHVYVQVHKIQPVIGDITDIKVKEYLLKVYFRNSSMYTLL